MLARNVLAITLNSLLVNLSLLSQVASPANTGQQAPVIRTTRREVLVDLVVRDKHHHLVTDLRPEEVEVYEQGVLQKINAFRGVAGLEQLETERSIAKRESSSHSDNSARINPVATLRQLNFVAVVFADIAPLNIEFAREAVLEFLKSDNLPSTYVSIYRLNRNLKVVQLYTEDKVALTKAVDFATKGAHLDEALGTQAKVVGSAFSTLQATAANILSSPQTDPTMANAVQNALLNPWPVIAVDPIFGRDAASEDASVTLGNAILAEARIENGIRFAANLSGGMDSLDSLREIVRSQEKLPGRKVVLYLSDGLDLPMNRRDAVDNLISYANRSGVAFYAVDTRGSTSRIP